jgi:hypothetical protein
VSKKEIEWYSIKTIVETCSHWVKLESGTQLNVMKKHRDEIVENGWGIKNNDIL